MPLDAIEQQPPDAKQAVVDGLNGLHQPFCQLAAGMNWATDQTYAHREFFTFCPFYRTRRLLGIAPLTRAGNLL
jgi:hypothetical protein